MGSESRDTRPTTLLTAALHIFALWSLAVAQPLYDLLGGTPEFFAVRSSRISELLIWIFLLSVLAPLTLVAVVATARALSRSAGDLVHIGLVAALTATLVLVATRRLDWAPIVLVGLALVVGIAVAIAVARLRAFGQYLTILAAGAVVFPLLFLFQGSVLRAVSRSPVEGIDMPPIETDIPIVLFVFDELPTLSLLNEDRRIDPIRYPNFAALADQALWFRYGATVSEFTTTAVPAMLSGLYPQPGLQPIAGDHPFNLFTLLGSSYEFNVVEAMGRLCPDSLCGGPKDGMLDRLSSLTSDSLIIYLHLVLPEAWRSSLPPVDQTWMEFGVDEANGGGARPRTIDDAHWERVFNERASGDRAADLLEFLGRIRKGSSRSLHFYHSFLPHVPFDYLPSGRLYSSDRQVEGRVVGEQWGGDEFAVMQSHQRHLLQVGFVDRQLGQIVDWLRSRDLLDSCLMIVVADHGSSHRPRDSRRNLTETNFADIAPVPFLIKLPGQQQGRIDDRAAQTVDILPTIAEVLGIELPWDVDGVSLLGSGLDGRDSYLVYRKGEEDEPVSFSVDRLREALDRAVDAKIELFGSGSDPEERFYQVGTHGALVGRSVTELPIREQGEVESEVYPSSHSDSFDPDSGFVPSHIRGRARSPQVGRAIDLAIALNGVIQATTRTWSFSTNKGWDEWSAIVNENAFLPGENEIQVFHIRSAGSRIELEPTTSIVLSSAAGTAPLGVEPMHGVEESGFHRPERFGDLPARWTSGNARLSIPFDSERPPKSVRIDLLWTGPEGTYLEVVLNGETRFAGDVPSGRWSSEFEIERPADDVIELELRSSTFVPRDTVEGAKDARQLGVAIGGIWLLGG